ncbi:glycoprotein [hymenopteran chu-related virus 126]|uniref:Glycoprotein n=1 Tax=hymenopteran chu-related virus 126 TaxID=2847798 RepID=A0A7U3NVC9_9VIRU|nr:glycoprotein [hymenopteran chu-related virus 126]QPB73968.1 glycoprotein [hymenopteran chu-related virus 126]
MVWQILILVYLSVGECTYIEPVIQSDAGAVSVSKPAVLLKAKSWLHGFVFDIECPHTISQPNLPVLIKYMHQSSNQLDQILASINMSQLDSETQKHFEGPSKIYLETKRIIETKMDRVKSKYTLLISAVEELTTITGVVVCPKYSGDDIGTDINSLNSGKRRKRDSHQGQGSERYGTYNNFNINERDTHISIYQSPHDRDAPTQAPGSSVSSDAQWVNNDASDKNVQSRGKFQPGQVLSQSIEDLGEQHPGSCHIAVENRLRYVQCVVVQMYPEQRCANKYIRCLNDSPRVKRGLFDFLGDVQNKLFGTATEAQLSDLHDIMTSLDAKVNLTSDTLIGLQNQTATLSKITMQAFKDMKQEIDNQLENLTQQIHNWAVSIEDKIRHTDARLQDLLLTQHVHMGVITMHTYYEILDTIDRTMGEYSNYISGIHEIIQSRKIPESLVNHTSLVLLWKTINDKTPDGYQLPNITRARRLVSTHIISAYAYRNQIRVVCDLPIVIRQDHLSFWEMRSAPIVRKEVAYSIYTNLNILVINKVAKEWTEMPTSEYLECAMTPDRICVFPYVWSTFAQASCHMSMHLENVSSSKLCKIHQNLVTEDEFPIFVPTGDRAWLVSTLPSRRKGLLVCVATRDIPARQSAINLPLLGIFKLPVECELRTYNSHIHSPCSVYGGSTLKMNLLLDQFSTNIQEVSIQDFYFEVPLLAASTDVNISVAHKKSDTLFEQSMMYLSDIGDKIASGKQLYMSTFDRISAEIANRTTIFNQSLSSSTSWIPSFSWPSFAVPIPRLLDILFILWLIYLSLRIRVGNPIMATAGVALNTLGDKLLPNKTFALPLPINSSITVNVTQTEEPQCAKHHTPWLIWVPPICVILMVIFHYHQTKLIGWSTRKIMKRMSWTPANKAVLIHPGESKVNIGILLQVWNAWRSPMRKVELVCCAVSVPGVPSSWYSATVDKITSSTVSGWFNRSSRMMKIRVNWNHVCMKSRDYVQVDTCEELPKDLSLAKADVVLALGSALPSFWWSLEPLAITHITLSYNGHTHQVYDYSWKRG